MAGLNDVDHSEQRPTTFVDDVCGVVKLRGDVGILSHIISALSICGGGRRVMSSGWGGDTTEGGSARPRAPAVYSYEMSVETAQKRAYAGNCYDLLLSDAKDDGHSEPGMLNERATSFIEELAELARRETLALEILCLVLLEPWRRNEDINTHRTDSTHGAQSRSEIQADDSLQSPLNGMLLKQASNRSERTCRAGTNCVPVGTIKANSKQLSIDPLALQFVETPYPAHCTGFGFPERCKIVVLGPVVVDGGFSPVPGLR